MAKVGAAVGLEVVGAMVVGEREGAAEGLKVGAKVGTTVLGEAVPE